MKLSKLFTKILREAPTDEEAINAKLLIRGGFINKEMAGVYNFLPLGLRVLNKIIGIVREKMNDLGGQEILMSSLQRPELWKSHFKQDRWSDENVDIWFKTKLKDGTEKGLAFTHEEPISNMLEKYISSYKDLSFSVYQFQTKFRNEIRAQGGLLRTREFMMKDLYSFSKNASQHDEFYEKVKVAYKNIFEKVGIDHKTYLTRASGGSFSKFSHEFQTICPAGEDTIYVHSDFDIAINAEIVDEKESFEDIKLSRKDFQPMKSIEVGNIFTLGTRFSEPNLTYKDEDGRDKLVFMGSYGFGPTRLIGTIVEIYNDEKGIIWPESVAPFRVHLIVLDGKNKEADEIYEKLTKDGVEILYDDRIDQSAGEKFADADLIGCPIRIVVSEKTLEKDSAEIKKRAENKSTLVNLNKLSDYLR